VGGLFALEEQRDARTTGRKPDPTLEGVGNKVRPRTSSLGKNTGQTGRKPDPTLERVGNKVRPRTSKRKRKKRVGWATNGQQARLGTMFTKQRHGKGRTLEENGIDIKLYHGLTGGRSLARVRELVEAFWALPAADYGDRQRPSAMRVNVRVEVGGKAWQLRCLVDGGASRNVIRDDIYEEMERMGLRKDKSVVVPNLRDINGRRVEAGGGARLKIQILPGERGTRSWCTS
jgi:hypothetical protein